MSSTPESRRRIPHFYGTLPFLLCDARKAVADSANANAIKLAARGAFISSLLNSGRYTIVDGKLRRTSIK